MKKQIGWVVLAVAVLAAAGTVQAAEEGWQYKITPYLWTMGLNGDIGVGPVSAPIDVSFKDAVEDLEFAFAMATEARNGAWGILVDGTYLNVGIQKTTSLGKIDVDLEQWTLQAAAAYRVMDTGNTLLDLGAGGRYLSFDTVIQTPADTADQEAAKGGIDPILVARLNQQFTEKFFGVLYGDIGGFGVTADLTWQAMASAGYAFTDWFSLLAGYRALGYDFDEGKVSLDVVEHGLLIGLTFSL